MSANRLHGLALLKIHRPVNVETEKVLITFLLNTCFVTYTFNKTRFYQTEREREINVVLN